MFLNVKKHLGMSKRALLPKNSDINDIAKFLVFVYLSDDYRRYQIKLNDPKRQRNQRYYERFKEEYRDYAKFKDVEEFHKRMHELERYKCLIANLRQDYLDYKDNHFHDYLKDERHLNLTHRYTKVDDDDVRFDDYDNDDHDDNDEE